MADQRWRYTDLSPQKREPSPGRHEINRDSTIAGGEWWIKNGPRILVVDPDKSARSAAEEPSHVDYYSKFIGELLRTSRKSFGRHIPTVLMLDTLKLAQKALPYSIEGRIAVEKRVQKDQPGTPKIELNYFLLHKVGVCEEQAALVGVTFELLQRMGELPQEMTFRLNRNLDTDNRSGHAWVRVEEPGFEPWIYDPAGNHAAPLSKRQDFWDYRTVNEKAENYFPGPRVAPPTIGKEADTGSLI